MPDPLVRFDVDDGVGIVRLDRPPANAISLQLALELVDVLKEAGSRDDVGAIVVWGGQKLLAAGADIKEMVDHGPDEIRKQVGALGDAADLLEALPKISIAVITGFALGGGFELSLGCDLRYAAENAKVGQPEVAIGVMPGAGGTQRMTWLAGLGVARDLTYTGRQIDAAEAKTLGLVDRVYPADEVFEAALRDAHGFAHGPRQALAAAKEALREAVLSPGPTGVAREKELFIALFGSHDQREGMRAFIEKRPPTFQGN
jgi:enoyl-CoA hydratase/carnithine racemase